MKITIILIGLVLLSVIEAFHDLYVIKNQEQGTKENDRKWHQFDFIFHIINAFLLAYLANNWLVVLAAGFIRWTVFQNLLNALRGKSIFYLGSSGMDGFIKSKLGNAGGYVLFVLSLLSLIAVTLKLYNIF